MKTIRIFENNKPYIFKNINGIIQLVEIPDSVKNRMIETTDETGYIHSMGIGHFSSSVDFPVSIEVIAERYPDYFDGGVFTSHKVYTNQNHRIWELHSPEIGKFFVRKSLHQNKDMEWVCVYGATFTQDITAFVERYDINEGIPQFIADLKLARELTFEYEGGIIDENEVEVCVDIIDVSKTSIVEQAKKLIR